MSDEGIWSRLRKGRLFQVLAVYLGASWVVLQVVGELRESLSLPGWVGPVSVILLVLGLLIVLATAWVQSHPLVARVGGGAGGETSGAASDGSEGAAAATTGQEPRPGAWELALGEATRSLKAGEVPRLTWARALLGGVFAFSLLFGFAGLYVLIGDRGESFQPAEAVASDAAAPAIAVLPFTVRGEGLDLWREGMVDALATNLDGAAGLRAVDSRTVLARWRERVSGADGASADLSSAIEVARATGARWALVGSVISAGSDVRLAATVHDVGTRRVLGEGRAQGSPDEIFALVDRLSIEVLRSLHADPELDSSFDLARVTTTSVAALKAFLEGQALYRRGEFDAAIPLFQRAVEEDSTFALAYHRLSDVYGWTGGVGSPGGFEALREAMLYVDRLPRRESLLTRAKHGLSVGDLGMVDSLRSAVRRYPDDAEAWYLLADAYLHSGTRLPSNLEEIENTFRRAVELDPGFAPYLIHWFDLAAWRRPDSAEAANRLTRLRNAAPDAPHIEPKQLVFDLTFGDSATRAARLDALETTPVDVRVGSLSEGFHNARFAPVRERVIGSLMDEFHGPRRGPWLGRLFQTVAYAQGQVSRGLEVLEDPQARRSPIRYCELWKASEMGLPVSEDVVEEAVPQGSPPREGPPCVHVADGARAVARGDTAELERVKERLTEGLRSFLEERSADSLLTARGEAWNEAQFRALDGYAAWRRGDLGAAAAALEEAVEHADEVARWWLVQVYLEQDRPAMAEPWLRSFWWAQHTLAYYHLGEAYEALGDTERAADAYRYFVEGWYDADPELQPLVVQARERLAALGDALEPAGI